MRKRWRFWEGIGNDRPSRGALFVPDDSVYRTGPGPTIPSSGVPLLARMRASFFAEQFVILGQKRDRAQQRIQTHQPIDFIDDFARFPPAKEGGGR